MGRIQKNEESAADNMIRPAETKVFSKKQILAAARYENRRDLAEALLEEERNYTMEEVDKMMSGFMKGKVN